MYFDRVVIGGGFYGCRVAMKLRQYGTVLLVERQPELMMGASRINVARVHRGYHYPRATRTAQRAQLSYLRFRAEYADCMDDEFPHYYAIHRDSVTSPQAFVEFSEYIGARVDDAPGAIRRMFRQADYVFEVREGTFDVDRLRARVFDQLWERRVEMSLGDEAIAVDEADDWLPRKRVTFASGMTVQCREVFNCTYSDLQRFAPGVPLELETVEVMLVEPPRSLAGAAVTVIDGPYFGLAPYPSRDGLWSLYHVVHSRRPRHEPGLPSSGAAAALEDARQILPVMSECRYRDSLFITRALMPRSAVDHSRPILLARTGHCVSVLGAKIDTVYDVESALEGNLDGLNVVESTCD